MDDLVKRLQPYVSTIGAIASLAVLGFLVQLLSLVRTAMAEQVNAARSQKDITEERLKKAEEDLERTEKWHQRELATLKEPRGSLQNRP